MKALKLTTGERIIIYYLLEEKKSRDPSQGDRIEKLQEIIRRGYSNFYGQICELMPEMPSADQREVMDTLQMFWVIQRSVSKLVEAGVVLDFDVSCLRFEGYDGHLERDLLALAKLVLSEEEGLGHFSGLSVPEHWNTHFPRRDHYQHMLQMFEGMNRPELTLDQLRQLAAVATRHEAVTV